MGDLVLMRMKPCIDAGKGRAIIEVSPSFSTDEIFTTIEALVTDPAFEPGFDLLTDHTQVTRFLTPEQAHGMIAFLSAHRDTFQGMRWAVVTSEPASYGMVRMLGTLMEPLGIPMAIFPSRAAAEGWLDGS